MFPKSRRSLGTAGLVQRRSAPLDPMRRGNSTMSFSLLLLAAAAPPHAAPPPPPAPPPLVRQHQVFRLDHSTASRRDFAAGLRSSVGADVFAAVQRNFP